LRQTYGCDAGPALQRGGWKAAKRAEDLPQTEKFRHLMDGPARVVAKNKKGGAEVAEFGQARRKFGSDFCGTIKLVREAGPIIADGSSTMFRKVPPQRRLSA